jgi:tetratricopeptide (TPR) repeat protein
MASKKKDYDRAVQLLDRAVRYEDALVYNEPPDWPASVRLTLGAVLLEAGRPVEAEAVYWDDLKKNPENGWALFGLTQALTAQGKKADAERIQARFVKAWSAADVTLTSSRF